MEAPKTEALKAAIEAIAEKAKDANSPGEAMQFAQAALNLAHTAALLHNMNVVLAIGGNMTTEVVHSLVAECAESALTPTSPGSAVWEPQEHEYVLPHVGQPHSAFRETEGERRSRLSAQRIAQSSARLLQGN